MSSPDPPELARVYFPPLVDLLIEAEATKGTPLTESEVIAIRDEAVSIETIPSHAALLDEKRGHRDVHPSRAWTDWQEARAEFARARLAAEKDPSS